MINLVNKFQNHSYGLSNSLVTHIFYEKYVISKANSGKNDLLLKI